MPDAHRLIPVRPKDSRTARKLREDAQECFGRHVPTRNFDIGVRDDNDPFAGGSASTPQSGSRLARRIPGQGDVVVGHGLGKRSGDGDRCHRPSVREVDVGHYDNGRSPLADSVRIRSGQPDDVALSQRRRLQSFPRVGREGVIVLPPPCGGWGMRSGQIDQCFIRRSPFADLPLDRAPVVGSLSRRRRGDFL